MKAMRKKSSGFFILTRFKPIAAATVFVAGFAGAYVGSAPTSAQGGTTLAQAQDLLEFFEPLAQTKVAQATPAPVTTITPVPTPSSAPPPPPPPPPPSTLPAAQGLIGSIGYANPTGNCVNEPGINRQSGNPITWTVTSQTPWIGATALWTYNHAGVVVGIWSNGDVEVRHQNYKGGQHRFPRSVFRGFR